jgi:FkbM family methyltransferase
MLRNPQQHVVIEANPELLPLLEENRDRNGCRFTILHRAVAYGSDEIAFHVNIDFWASNVNTSTDRFVKVPTISLQEVFEQFGFERCTLICDIEGGEIDLVQHEAEILKQRVATFVVEVHPWCIQADIIDAMLHGLEIIGFTCVYGRDNNYVLHNMAYHQKEA